MPNIASIFKEEITRLARKELRVETESLKKASSQYRSDIAALKRQVTALERKLSRTEKVIVKRSGLAVESDAGAQIRYSAKGLRKLRDRLALSGPELALLLKVSAQTIYNWEAGTTRPRDKQLTDIVALRKVGKREVGQRLEELSPSMSKAS